MANPTPPRHLGRRRHSGITAERAAGAMLVRAGLHALASNVDFRVGELDLVMRDGDTLVFVEVRYRASSRYGGGAASIDFRKRRRIARAAAAYLARTRPGSPPLCRFDVVEASGDADAPRLHWIRDAFRMEDVY